MARDLIALWLGGVFSTMLCLLQTEYVLRAAKMPCPFPSGSVWQTSFFGLFFSLLVS